MGREAEVARIGAAVGQVRRGEGHVLVVTGDAGRYSGADGVEIEPLP